MGGLEHGNEELLLSAVSGGVSMHVFQDMLDVFLGRDSAVRSPTSFCRRSLC